MVHHKVVSIKAIIARHPEIPTLQQEWNHVKCDACHEPATKITVNNSNHMRSWCDACFTDHDSKYARYGNER